MTPKMKALIFRSMVMREARKIDVECARWKGKPHRPLYITLMENRFRAKRNAVVPKRKIPSLREQCAKLPKTL